MLNNFSIIPGAIKLNELKKSNFINNVFEEKDNGLFVQLKEKNIPIFTRDISMILYNNWGNLVKKHKKNINSEIFILYFNYK